MVTRRRKGRIRREESNLASNQFTMCSPQSGTLREGSWSYIENRRGRGPGDQKEIEATWWIERRVQRGREQSSQ